MAKNSDEFTPVSYEAMREMTRPLPPIPDNRGPLNYDPSFTPSLNGIIPDSTPEADTQQGE